MNKERPPENQEREEDGEDFDEVDRSLLLTNEHTSEETYISVEKTADGETIMKIKDDSENESD